MSIIGHGANKGARIDVCQCDTGAEVVADGVRIKLRWRLDLADSAGDWPHPTSKPFSCQELLELI